MPPAHLIQWCQGIGSFVAEGTASSPDGESCCFHSMFFFIVRKHPHSDGKPALLAHPPLPVAQGTFLQSQECSAQPLGGLMMDKSHPSPSSLACMSGTEERRSSSCCLTPQTRAMHVRTASLWRLSHRAERAGSRNTNTAVSRNWKLWLPGTWAQGSLLGSGAGVVPAGLRLAWTCLFPNQVTGSSTHIPQECLQSPSTLKQSALAHIYSCHKSVLLLRAARSRCSSHASSHRAVLRNCTQLLASPFNLCFTLGLSAMLTGTSSQQNLANIVIFFPTLQKKKKPLPAQQDFFLSFMITKQTVFLQNSLPGKTHPLLHQNEMFLMGSWPDSQLCSAYLVMLIIWKFGAQRFILQDKVFPRAKVHYLKQTLRVPQRL